ncbi:MAG: 4-(cytidine 5'-diphospho)-2-C-methyl-D-erythritol kinase, partial [Oscillospiraceae bacterium]
MIVNAAAKINLMLDILGKTDNGYHSLYMIM